MIKKIRTCVHCLRTSAEVAFFTRKRVRKCGTYVQVQNICVDCQRDYRRYYAQRFYEQNPTAKKEANRRWKLKSKEKIREIDRAWHRKKRGYDFCWEKAKYDMDGNLMDQYEKPDLMLKENHPWRKSYRINKKQEALEAACGGNK